MTSTETALEPNKVLLAALLVLARMVGQHVLAECPTESQLLLETILQKSICPGRILLPQVVDVHDQSP